MCVAAGTLKCDFGACAALETSAYVSVRIKFLRHLRLKCKSGMEDVEPMRLCEETVHLTDRILLVVRWDEMMASVVERVCSIPGT